jgi:N-acetylglucosamine kinase-like BadF-type ATPase
VSSFLGVDGGGSKTRFLLIDDAGTVLARHAEGPAYYLEIGLDALRALLARGIQATLAHAALQAAEVSFAFLGLPAYGEDTRLLPELDAIAAGALMPARHRCGNDMVCGWAGALGGADGINIVAGTGSIAYGEYGGRAARAGGFGELFSDEGSAYWLTREGLQLFTRMSDGRTARGALYDIVRRHFGLRADLDLCAAVYGTRVAQRSEFASLARLVSEAAQSGDRQAQALFDRAAQELAQIIDAVHAQLQVPVAVVLPVSYSGGLFGAREPLLPRLRAALQQRNCYRLAAPRLPPDAGAALYAARLAGTALAEAAMARLQQQLAPVN